MDKADYTNNYSSAIQSKMQQLFYSEIYMHVHIK